MFNTHKQQGIGLVEVMISLAILVLMILGASTVQVASQNSARLSGVHFSLEHLASDIIETLRADINDASEGAYDFDASEEVNGALTQAQSEVSAWNDRVAEQLPSGSGNVSCTSDNCNITISWYEVIDGANHRQVYNARTPL